MRANRRARRLAADDEAVSVAVGAILLAGILAAFLVTVRLSYVPAWEKDVESLHLRHAEHQMAVLASSLASTRPGADPPAVSVPVRLAPAERVLFAGPRPAGELSVATSPGALRIDSSQMTTLLRNGTSLAGLGAAWRPVEAPTVISDVASVEYLMIRISEFDDTYVDSTLTVGFSDATGAEAARLTGTVQVEGGVPMVGLHVTNADGSTTTRRTDVVSGALLGTEYYLDVLDPVLRIPSLLTTAPTPITITISAQGFLLTGLLGGSAVEYTVAYHRQADDGTRIPAGDGIQVAGFSDVLAGMHASYAYEARHFVAQEFTIEHGAVVLSQADGATVRSAPGIHVRAAGSAVAVTLTVPAAQGAGGQASGARTASLAAIHLTTASWSGVAPDLTINMTTDHPEAWRAFWQLRLGDAGLQEGTAGTGAFSVETGERWTRVTILGPDASSVSTAADVVAVVMKPTYQLEVR